MLRIEAYPALGGLVVRIVAPMSHRESADTGDGPTAVTRTIDSRTIEAVGLEEAFRDVVVDVITLYPGLLHHALKSI